jgi:hypothetical protein
MVHFGAGITLELVDVVVDLDEEAEPIGLEILGLVTRHPGLAQASHDSHGPKEHVSVAAGADAVYIRFSQGRSINQVVRLGAIAFDSADRMVAVSVRMDEGSWAAFLSRDTLFGELSTPISLNRYTYAYASPLDYWDPDGRVSIEAANSYDNYTTRPRPAAARPAGTADSMERRLTTPRRATTTANIRAIEAADIQTVRKSALHPRQPTMSADSAARRWAMSIPDRPRRWPGGNCPGSGSSWNSCIAQRLTGGEGDGCADIRITAMCAQPEPEQRTGGTGCSTSADILYSCQAINLEKLLNGGFSPPQQLPNPCPGAPIGANTHCIDQEAAGGRYVDAAEDTDGSIESGPSSKPDSRRHLGQLGLPPDQQASANRAIGSATTSSTIEIVKRGSDVVIRVSRPGADGYQVIEHVVGPDGTKSVTQLAYDSKGNLTHYDPKV